MEESVSRTQSARESTSAKIKIHVPFATPVSRFSRSSSACLRLPKESNDADNHHHHGHHCHHDNKSSHDYTTTTIKIINK